MRAAALYVYPIKSCRATPVSQLHISSRGPKDDRDFMLVEEKDTQKFITQRGDPELVFVQPTLTEEGLRIETVDTAPTKLSPIFVARERWEALRGFPIKTKVHTNDCQGVDQGHEIAEWFSTYLGRRVRLLYMPESFKRIPNRVPGNVAEATLKFADGYPLLLTTYASLVELNARLPPQYERFTMDQFRPNIVVASEDTSMAPWEEETWNHFTCGSVSLYGVKPCDRCVIITTNQQTSERQHAKLLIAHAEIHSAPKRSKTNPALVQQVPIFGMNLIPASSGSVTIGEAIGNITFGSRPEL